MEHISWLLLAVIASAFGGYLGAYLKKKGENLATHEDLDKLIAEVEATTAATKAIEERLSNETWDRQRKWELKRDTLLETVHSIAAYKHANIRVIAAFTAARKTDQTDPNVWIARKGETVDSWEKAQERFENARLMTALIGDEAMNHALANLGVSLRQSYSAITKHAPEERFHVAMQHVNQYHHEAMVAIRNALGLPNGDWPDYASIQ